MNCLHCNKEFIGKSSKKYCSNSCKSLVASIKYYWVHREKELYKKKLYYVENRKEIIKKNAEYCDKRRKVDVDFRLKRYLRSRLYNAVKNEYKAGSAIRDLGCSIVELKTHLAEKFTAGMSWDNYGKWHIDHIQPLDNFNLSDSEQVKTVCHYSNLQPLWGPDNIRKSNK